jgi:hypothetical protein
MLYHAIAITFKSLFNHIKKIFSKKTQVSQEIMKKNTRQKNEKNTRQISRESLREDDYDRIPAVPRTDDDAVDVYWVLLCMALGLSHCGKGPRHIEIG